MSVAYSLNGYTISGKSLSEGIYLLDGTEYAPALSPRVATVEVPNSHYALPMYDDPLSQITVGLKVRVQGRDPNHLRELWNALTARFNMGLNRPITMVRTRGTTTETADAKLVSADSPDFSCARNRVDATIVLAIPGGAWRGPYVEQSFPLATGQTLPTSTVSTRPIADAMIRVIGPVNRVTVHCTQSNTGVQWGDGVTSVPSGQYLLIDPASMQARIQSTASWDIFNGQRANTYLVFTGYRPLAFASLYTGGAGAGTSRFDVSAAGGANQVTIRSRYAVV